MHAGWLLFSVAHISPPARWAAASCSPGPRSSAPLRALLLQAIFGFPLALTLVVFTGTDLFTSSCMYSYVGLIEGGWVGGWMGAGWQSRRRRHTLRLQMTVLMAARAPASTLLLFAFGSAYDCPASLALPPLPPTGKFGLYGAVRMLIVPYFSNLVGSLLLLGLQAGSETFKGKAAAAFLIAVGAVLHRVGAPGRGEVGG